LHHALRAFNHCHYRTYFAGYVLYRMPRLRAHLRPLYVRAGMM
jgi:hypothetical protein